MESVDVVRWVLTENQWVKLYSCNTTASQSGDRLLVFNSKILFFGTVKVREASKATYHIQRPNTKLPRRLHLCVVGNQGRKCTSTM